MTELTNRIGLSTVEEMDPAMIAELADFKRQLASVTDQLRRNDGTIDVEKIFELPQKIDDLTKRLDHVNKTLADRIEQVEKIKFVEFKNNDVYEVNKRIERLERKIALLESKSNLSAVGVNFILTLIAINNLFLGLAWWIYG